jgi:hypothetical protein
MYIISCLHLDVFWQICHDHTKEDLWCLWASQSVQHPGLIIWLPLIAIEGGWQSQTTFWKIDPYGKDSLYQW